VFSKELIDLIVRVITSWQVIAVTLGIVAYAAIVSNVARLYRNSRPKPRARNNLVKRKKEKAAPEADETDETDDLGLGD
jgi:hypothetical protein